MSDPRKPATSNVPGTGQTKRRGPAATPSETAARTGQPWPRSVPPSQGLEDGISSPLISQQSPPQRAGKVPIPRLRRDIDGPSGTTASQSSDSKHRVSHACESCRQRKTKCSGERPVCKHCEDFKIFCVYEDGKRDRTRKYICYPSVAIEEN